MRGFVPFVMMQGMIRHLQGERRGERRATLDMARLHPTDDRRVLLEITSNASHGSPAKVLRAVERAMAAGGTGPRGHPMSIARYAADELRQHGRAAAAQQVLRLGLDWWEGAPVANRTSLAEREQVELLRRAGDWPAARAALEPLLAEFPNDIELRTLRGVIAAAVSDAAGVAEALAWLAQDATPYTFGLPDYGRARILAASGRPDESLAALRAAIARGRPLGMRMHQEPDLDPLRGLDAYIALAEPWRLER